MTKPVKESSSEESSSEEDEPDKPVSKPVSKVSTACLLCMYGMSQMLCMAFLLVV